MRRHSIRKRKIKVDDFELRVIIKALNEFRNQLISYNKTTNDVDVLLLRLPV